MTWLVVAGLGATVVAAVAVPRAAGWTPLTVLSGSMAPAYPVGSQVVVAPVRGEAQADRLRVGDVITFRPESPDAGVVTHRIVAKTHRSDGAIVLSTRGDANKVDDPWQLTADQVYGKVRYHVPYVGYVATWLPPPAKAAGVLAVALGLLGYGGWHLVPAVRSGDRRGRSAGRHRAGDQPRLPGKHVAPK